MGYERAAAQCTPRVVTFSRLWWGGGVCVDVPGRELYLVSVGYVDVINEHTGALLGPRLGPGSHFGEIGLLFHVNRTASVVVSLRGEHFPSVPRQDVASPSAACCAASGCRVGDGVRAPEG